MESTAEVNTQVNKALVNSPLLHQRDLHWYPGNQPLVAGGSRARANSITTRASDRHGRPKAEETQPTGSIRISKTIIEAQFASQAADGVITVAVVSQHSMSSPLTKGT